MGMWKMSNGKKNKIPVFEFPWSCWRCHKKISVVYPIDKNVQNTSFGRGLKVVYSKTLGSHVIGNVCSYCGAYQGNFFVQDDAFMGNVYELNNFLLGFFDAEIHCGFCGKAMPNELLGNNSIDYVGRLNDYEGQWVCRECQIEKGFCDICYICKRNSVDFPKLKYVTHHTSYKPEKTITVCRTCHMMIHRSNNYPKLKPKLTE